MLLSAFNCFCCACCRITNVYILQQGNRWGSSSSTRVSKEMRFQHLIARPSMEMRNLQGLAMPSKVKQQYELKIIPQDLARNCGHQQGLASALNVSTTVYYLLEIATTSQKGWFIARVNEVLIASQTLLGVARSSQKQTNLLMQIMHAKSL